MGVEVLRGKRPEPDKVLLNATHIVPAALLLERNRETRRDGIQTVDRVELERNVQDSRLARETRKVEIVADLRGSLRAERNRKVLASVLDVELDRLVRVRVDEGRHVAVRNRVRGEREGVTQRDLDLDDLGNHVDLNIRVTRRLARRKVLDNEARLGHDDQQINRHKADVDRHRRVEHRGSGERVASRRVVLLAVEEKQERCVEALRLLRGNDELVDGVVATSDRLEASTRRRVHLIEDVDRLLGEAVYLDVVEAYIRAVNHSDVTEVNEPGMRLTLGDVLAHRIEVRRVVRGGRRDEVVTDTRYERTAECLDAEIGVLLKEGLLGAVTHELRGRQHGVLLGLNRLLAGRGGRVARNERGPRSLEDDAGHVVREVGHCVRHVLLAELGHTVRGDYQNNVLGKNGDRSKLGLVGIRTGRTDRNCGLNTDLGNKGAESGLVDAARSTGRNTGRHGFTLFILVRPMKNMMALLLVSFSQDHNRNDCIDTHVGDIPVNGSRYDAST